MSPDIFSLLPPVAAIMLALLTRRVILSLFVGVLLGMLILQGWSVPAAALETLRLFGTLLGTDWILKTLTFAILVGSVMELVRRSGGIDGFIALLRQRYKIVRSRREALLMVYFTGLVIFVESTITSLIAGSVGRPLGPTYRFSREKLAYVCDSTAAPVCSILLINGWGALLLGLIATQIEAGVIAGENVGLLLQSVLFNFYAFAALALTFLVIWFDWDIGAMRRMPPMMTDETIEARHGDASLMLLPLLSMIAGVFLFLFITGEGNILKGSGSTAVFGTMVMTLAIMAIQYRIKQAMDWSEYFEGFRRGALALLPIALILFFAFAIGKVIDTLQTGHYLASFACQTFDPQWLGAVIFVLASVMAFATGTSWGTFSVMIPIAVPMAAGMDVQPALVIGAVISGGVFGDHCSPISDTTIIASMAAGCEHIDHVRTQLPYALIAGGFALVLFAFSGFLLT